MRIVPSEEFLGDAFAARWQTLLDHYSPHDLGQTPVWNQCWWRHFGAPGSSAKELFVLADEQSGCLQAVWPFFVRKRHGLRVIHWIGQTEGMITDYMTPIVATPDRERATLALLEFLAERADTWDFLDVTLPGWSSTYPSFTKTTIVHGPRMGLQWKGEIVDHSSSIMLPSTFEAFLESLGNTTRRHIRQYLRGADRAGARFEIASGCAVVRDLPELFRLNAERWAVFNGSSSRHFLTEVTERLAAAGSLFLASMRMQDQMIATALCYRHDGTTYVHSAGVVRQSPKGFSAGTTLYTHLIRALIDKRCSRLDLSPGLEEYKLRLGASVETVLGFTLWKRSAAYRRWKAIQAVRQTKRWILGLS
jgi:CelD/BcsL family acetyltransferase involved in cellulose biosynthesis